MKRLSVALLAGGDSSEREIALQSAAQIEQALSRDRYEVHVIDVHGRDWLYTDPAGRRWPLDRNDFSLTVDGRRTGFDYALIVIHGTPGEDGRLPAYLDMMGVPYSSCGMVSSVVTFDKITAKRALREEGIPLAREVLVRRGERVDAEAVVGRLGLPLFVKPNASGSSFGVTKVRRVEELGAALEAAFRESPEALIEEFIAGRELDCGVMIAGDCELRLPVAEIVPKGEFFDYKSKYEAGCSDEIVPADLPADTARRLLDTAVRAYRLCRCRGLVRAEFILTPEGVPYFIEINSIPGMSAGSIVPKMARAAGMTLGELYDRIIEATLHDRD